MNIYTVEEAEAQAALELVKALEAKHGWQGVGVQITENKDAPHTDGYRNIAVKVTPPEGKALNYEHSYALEEGLTWPDKIVGQVDGKKAQAAERLGATLVTLRAAVADGDLTRADVEAETEAVQTAAQPKAKAPAAPAKRHAGRKTAPKGKRS
jgi:hypothetical protein